MSTYGSSSTSFVASATIHASRVEGFSVADRRFAALHSWAIGTMKDSSLRRDFCRRHLWGNVQTSIGCSAAGTRRIANITVNTSFVCSNVKFTSSISSHQGSPTAASVIARLTQRTTRSSGLIVVQLPTLGNVSSIIACMRALAGPSKAGRAGVIRFRSVSREGCS